MELALAHHDTIMRDAIESNDGYLVKTTGDGVIAAFATAPAAVAACLAAQRSLTKHAWGEFTIKSRMAVHSGAAEQRDGDYHGPALNRAARLMASGHGGQILLSLATEELVRDQLPVNIALRDLGERRLKDLIRPEHVYQVIAPGLAADFPPLKTLDARPNNLPAQTTPFIGREDAIRAVKKQMSNAEVRLLTLTGVGGTGKTRLALQVAADLVDDFEHGVFFVPLAALSDPDLVLPTIAKAFDVREAPGRSLQEQLHNHLREKQTLFVLDNFEQVIEAAPRVSDLLTAAPLLKVLVTSREVLRLTGETEYPVQPLSLPDPKRVPPLERLTQYEAVALFIDRAVAVKPRFAVTNENAPAVAEICHKLDGLPLAIELAAAHTRVLPPQRMLAELSHRLTFLVGGARDLPARQKTLRSTIDWSHDLLTGDEQNLFRRLAVFVGGATLEVIETVCAIESDRNVLETVESLVGKSLLQQQETNGVPRFAMLETIREYAGDRLRSAGEEERMRERHRDAFLSLAEVAEPKLLGAEQAAWLQQLEGEHENLRASFNWSLAEAEPKVGLRLCGALYQFWITRGHFFEGREWSTRALTKAGGGAFTPERARTLTVAGGLARLQGDYPTARLRFEESLAISRELADQRGVASSLTGLGLVAYAQGDYPAADALHEESLEIGRKLGDPRGIAKALRDLGSVAIKQGNYPAARARLEESLGLLRELGDRWGIAASLNNLGVVADDQGDYEASSARHEESLAIRRELGDRWGIAASLNNLGNLAFDQGDYQAARARHEETLAISRELGDQMGIANSLGNLGNDAYSQGDYAAAQALHSEGLAIRREIQDNLGIVVSLEGLVTVFVALGSSLRATRILGAAERLREKIGSPLPPTDRSEYDQIVAAARAKLSDDAAFDHAWQEGRALTLEQAIALALEGTFRQP